MDPGAKPDELESLLEPVLESLEPLGGIQREVHLKAISKKYDVPKRALNKLAKEALQRVRAQKRASADREKNASKVISLVPAIELTEKQPREVVEQAVRCLCRLNEKRLEVYEAKENKGEE